MVEDSPVWRLVRRWIDVPMPPNGDTLRVCYRPLVFHMDRQLEARMAAAPGPAGVLDFLLAALAEWDAVDADDKPIPITRETLSRLLTVEHAAAISDAIARHLGQFIAYMKANGGRFPPE